MMTEQQIKNARIQFITHFNDKYDYLDSAIAAVEGGCRWVQLRIKDATIDEIRPIAIKVSELCRNYGATFIIDDHVELVREINADGVHVGKNDMPVENARKILGKGYIIGATANTIDDIIKHHQSGADYIGCGPLRFTTTKRNLSPVIGIDGYKKIIEQMHRMDINLPIVAIGGITPEDIVPLRATGVTGIAISSTIINAPDPIEQMKLFIEKLA